MSQEEIDFVNRDPNDLNDHLKVRFDDVIGEPDGAHSINCVWKNSAACFNCCKGCCYNIMTICCGIPMAMMWGCSFAIITFQHVWAITPCLRCFMIQVGCCQKLYGTCIKCYLQPVCEAYSYCFSNIRVTKIQG